MVDVKTSNVKLEARARAILRSILQSLPKSQGPAAPASRIDLDDDEAVSRLVKQAGGVKLAAIMARWGCSLADARERLDESAGVLKAALDNGS
jgi:N-acetylmuramic acid 6-phosphate (MurNAc-6-P) etherase